MVQQGMTLDEFLREWHNGEPAVTVRTSGSTGIPKLMRVEKSRMRASARTTCDFLGLHKGDAALLCMPLDYIAGKMMVVRSLERQMRLISVPPSGHPLAQTSEHIDFAAMVPMQVYNSMQTDIERERLMNIDRLIIGGGAIDPQMESELAKFPNEVWSTYGMTETLSHIAMRRISGSDGGKWYRPLPGVEVWLAEDGCLAVNAPMVHDGHLFTNDRAELCNGMFRILGRKDNVIDSGGIKIQAEEVEELLRPHLSVGFAVTGCPHPKFGEMVVLCIESTCTDEAMRVCGKVLPKYWQPKVYVSVETIPTTGTGKVARAQLRLLAEEKLG